MFNNSFSRTALSAFGALLLTATLVGAAVGPAHMVETAPVGYAGAAPQVGSGIGA